MKVMKKFSLLVALALVVTIGGVYATWNYASGNDVGATESNLTLNLTNYALIGGGLAPLEGTSITVTIDDTNDDHEAELTMAGTMIFIFTPSGSTTQESIESMNFNFTFAAVSTDSQTQWTYTAPGEASGKEIFKIDSTSTIKKQVHLITDSNSTSSTGIDLSSKKGSYYMELTANELNDIITLNGQIELKTVEAWDAFDQALRTGNLTVTVAAESTTSTTTAP